MASKYELVSALAESTAQDLSRDPAAWMRFLDTAGRMYRYPFMDQLLIHAQRPDATACAELEVWNEKMNCWVNKGSKGIALLTERNGWPRLRYVFDVSNVHPAWNVGRLPYIWQMRERDEGAAIAQLEKTYGKTDENRSLGYRLLEIADRIAEDYSGDLLPDLKDRLEDSLLYGLDDLNLETRIRDTLRDSIGYMLLSRCGQDTADYDFSFEYLQDFNNLQVMSVLGNAVSEMTEPLLMEIGRTVRITEQQIARQEIREDRALETAGNRDNAGQERIVNEVSERQKEAGAGNISPYAEKNENGLANGQGNEYNALKRESKRQGDISTDDYVKGESAETNEAITEEVKGGNDHGTDLHAERG
ncbi:MAG: helicase SNF2, partial [Oribacterium sp.]|nr:helicase SNF2 [Oribacterium sp.]